MRRDRLPLNGAVSFVHWRRDAPPVAHLSLGKENRLSPSRRSSYHRRLSSRSCTGRIAIKGLKDNIDDDDDDDDNDNEDDEDDVGDEDEDEDGDKGEDEAKKQS